MLQALSPSGRLYLVGELLQKDTGRLNMCGEMAFEGFKTADAILGDGF